MSDIQDSPEDTTSPEGQTESPLETVYNPDEVGDNGFPLGPKGEPGSLGIDNVDLQNLVKETGVGIDQWEDKNNKGKESHSLAFDSKNKEIMWDGKAISQKLQGLEIKERYDEIREKIAKEGRAIWAFQNEKGLWEATIYKVDKDGNLTSKFLAQKEPDLVEPVQDDITDVEINDTETSSDNSFDIQLEPKHPFERVNVFFAPDNTRETYAQKETRVVAGDSVKSRLETPSVISTKSTKTLFLPQAIAV